MKPMTRLAAALSASLALYLAVFSVVHRPLTVGDIPRQLEHKLRYASSLPSPRLVIFAGSNGRYSHRCEPMARPLQRPCVNMSVAMGIGLDFMLEQLQRTLRPGDTVYMPLEYGQYLVQRDEMDAGMHNPVLVHDLRDQLWQRQPGQIARAWSSFDLPFLVHGLAEMALARTGFQRRTSLDTLTAQGDERGHTAAKGQPYREYLRSVRFGPVAVPADSHAMQVLAAFLRQQRQRGITVVGGLPTVPDEVELPADVEPRLRALFEGAGQRFVVLDNRSRYPLSCFFDTLSHLHEECQLAHSAQVGAALAALAALPTQR